MYVKHIRAQRFQLSKRTGGAEASFDRFQHITWIKGETDALPCHFHISACL